jgi:hypothetical protein
MNNFHFDKKYTLRVMFNNDLLKIKIPEKVTVKDILIYLKNSLKLPNESCLRLYYFTQNLSENQIFSENELKKFKENLLLIQDERLSSEDINSHHKIKKVGLNDSFSSKHSSIKSKKKSATIPIEEAIMKCTGANHKMSKSKSLIIKERRGFGQGELNSMMNLLISRGLEGHIRHIDDEGEDEEFFEYLDDNSSDSESSYLREIHSHSSDLNPNQNNQSNQNQVVINSPNLSNEAQINYQSRRIVNYDLQLLAMLIEMGFPEENCRIALRLANNDLNYASNILLLAPPEIFNDNQHLAGENSLNVINPAPIVDSNLSNSNNENNNSSNFLVQPNIFRIQSESLNQLNHHHVFRLGVDQYGHNSKSILR